MRLTIMCLYLQPIIIVIIIIITLRNSVFNINLCNHCSSTQPSMYVTNVA